MTAPPKAEASLSILPSIVYSLTLTHLPLLISGAISIFPSTQPCSPLTHQWCYFHFPLYSTSFTSRSRLFWQ